MVSTTESVSERPQDTLQLYLEQARRHPLLSAQQESATAAAMRAGREQYDLLESAPAFVESRRTLIESNLRLVVFVARRYRGMGMELSDLVQEGNLGLLEAVERFDPRRNVRFSTYATWWIRQAITRALSQKSRCVRVPLEKLVLARTAAKARSQMETRLARRPTVDEIATEIGRSAGKVQAALNFLPLMESLDARIGEDGSARSDMQPDVHSPSPLDSVLSGERRDKVQSLLKLLPERQRLIVRMRFGLGLRSEHSLAEIGKRLHLSRERVRQLQAEALRRLREAGVRRGLDALI